MSLSVSFNDLQFYNLPSISFIFLWLLRFQRLKRTGSDWISSNSHPSLVFYNPWSSSSDLTFSECMTMWLLHFQDLLVSYHWQMSGQSLPKMCHFITEEQLMHLNKCPSLKTVDFDNRFFFLSGTHISWANKKIKGLMQGHLLLLPTIEHCDFTYMNMCINWSVSWYHRYI